MAQGPKDIPETIAQASAAAAKAIGLLCKDKLTCNGVAHSDEMMCNGCWLCANVCPYGAITYVIKNSVCRTELPRYAEYSPSIPPSAGLRSMYSCMSFRSNGFVGILKRTGIVEVDAICK